MKKLYTLVMIMFAVSMTFAQQQMPLIKAVPQKVDISKFIVDQTKGDNHGWYNYAEGMAFYMYGENYWSEYLKDLQQGWPMLADRIGKYPYGNGATTPQIQSFAQVFDFSQPIYWSELYETLNNGIPIPATGTSFGIDSVQLLFHYTRGKQVPADIVDTLIISFAMNMNVENVRMLTQDGQTPLMHFYSLPFSVEDHTIDQSKLDAGAIVYTEKILLDTAYEMGNYIYRLSFPVPEELASVDGKLFAISYSYMACTDNRTDSSMMGEDINLFQAVALGDPRPEYQQTAFGVSKALVGQYSDRNTSLFAGAEAFKQGGGWYGQYMPTIVWETDHPRPFIGFHMTNCEGCGQTKVADMEKKSINVYPNPATSTVNVKLVDNSQANIQLFNLVGQVVMSEQVNGQDLVTLNVNNLNNGIYMLKVNQNGKVYTSKVVVR